MTTKVLRQVLCYAIVFIALGGHLLANDAKYDRNANYFKAMELLKNPLAVQKKEPIDVSKAFVNALIRGDRSTVEKLLGYSERNIDFIYSDKKVLDSAIEYYKKITRWEQKYHSSSVATVTAYGIGSGGFELSKSQGIWIISTFY